MSNRYNFFAGGGWYESAQTIEVTNPYNNDVIGVVYEGSESDLKGCLDKAEEAFKETKKLSSYKKAEILEKISNGIKERKEELARSITLESGKPITSSRVEVDRAVNTFSLASEESKRIYGEVIPLDLVMGSENRVGITRRFPVGIIVGICPFNFPLNLVSHKIAPAIASGNPIIIKPASKTPVTALILAEIISGSGAVPGSVNIIPCNSRLIERILGDGRVKMLSFTGSADVGWYLKGKAARKKVVLELGGNAGVIIHSDADIEYAAKRCMTGGFSYSGQTCISVQNIYIHQDIYQRFADIFIPMVKGLNMGDPLDENTDISPLIDIASAKKTEEWVREAKESGAKVLTGGRREGLFFEPTVITDIIPDMKVRCKEIFAPVVNLIKYSRFEDAVSMMNDSVYGLQAGVFTKDIDRISYAYNELDVGGVLINEVPTYRADHMPYGGIKESGFGREGIRYAIEEMTELKMMGINIG